jgi:hypothetical protein
MRVVKRLVGRAARWLAPLAVLGLAAAPAAAYLPPVDDMLERVAVRAPGVTAAILEFTTQVYPVALGLAAGEPAPTQPDKKRSFRQRVYWQRGALLAVETLAEDGAVLAVSVADKAGVQEASVASSRRFSEADLRLAVYPFLEGRASAWRSELNFWGVLPNQVHVAMLKGGVFYRVQESPEKALWVERETLRPAVLASQIEGPEPLALTIEFSDFLALAVRGERQIQSLPRKTTFRISGQRFKETVLGEYEINPPARKFPLQRLRQQAGGGPARRER